MADPFQDRAEAGRALGSILAPYANRTDVLVLALPRGGVPVAHEIATALKAPLDVFLVRKLGVPGHEELAMGAIATGGVRILNQQVVTNLRIPPSVIDTVTSREQRELERRGAAYRDGRPAPSVRNQVVLLVDDGLATGSTMRAAVAALYQQEPERIVVAVPVGEPSTCQQLRREVDEVICLIMPELFQAVGQWYRNFAEVSDATVRELLRASGPGGQVQAA